MIDPEITWRKMPRNILTDPAMDYISSCLPHQYAAAPYMFYQVALSIADGDGIFDLEDGVIFARLMHMGDPQLVMDVANLMLKRKIISRAGTSTKCMLTDWEYSIKAKPRTMEDRRRIAQQHIEAERAAKSQAFQELPQAGDETAEEVFTVDFTSTSASSDDFLCPFDDKTSENVVENNQTEKIREDKNREIEKTHTEIEREEGKPLQANYEALRDLPNENEYEIEQEQWDGTETTCSDDMAELAQQAIQVGQLVVISEQQKRVLSILQSFFAKNCLGYDENDPKQASCVAELVNRIGRLGTKNNPVEIVASTLLGQFKKLSEEKGYFHGYSLFPEELVKPNFYKHALQLTSNILLSGKTTDPAWIEQLQQDHADIETERETVGDAFDDQYIQYGIDPQDPNRAQKLMQARKGTKLND